MTHEWIISSSIIQTLTFSQDYSKLTLIISEGQNRRVSDLAYRSFEDQFYAHFYSGFMVSGRKMVMNSLKPLSGAHPLREKGYVHAAQILIAQLGELLGTPTTMEIQAQITSNLKI